MNLEDCRLLSKYIEIEDLESLSLEDLDSKITKDFIINLPAKIQTDLIFNYLIKFNRLDKLESSRLFEIFDFREFVSNHASYFFFSFSDLIVFTEHSTKSDEIVNAVNNCKRTSIKRFTKILVDLVPDLIIDDILTEMTEKIISLENDNQLIIINGIKHKNLTIDLKMAREKFFLWIYNLLVYKNFKRSILRYIFDSIIYYDSEFNFIRFAIIDLIIQKYSEMDKSIKNSEMENEIKDLKFYGKSTIESLKLNAIAKQNDMNSNVIDVIEEELSNYIDKTTDKISKNFMKIKTNGIAENKFFSYYVDKSNIGEDNVFVLSNLVWEELLIYFKEVDFLKSDVLCSILELLATLIRVTGDFFRKRINDNKNILKKFDDSAYSLVVAIIENFTTIETLKPEINDFISKMTDENLAADLKQKISSQKGEFQ